MSSNKRRKLEAAAATEPGKPAQNAHSAVSAMLARRRLAAEAASGSEPGTPASSDEETPSRRGPPNAFSALQKLSRQGDSHSVSAVQASRKVQSPSKTPRPAASKRNESKTATSEPVEDLSPLIGSHVVQFSSFRPTKQNYRVTASGVVQLRLPESERFLVLGSFGIKVIDGEVTVAGATLKPSAETQWIHAPLCHAIPVLRTTERTRLEIYADPTAKNLRRLGNLSPLFRRIWNDRPDSATNGGDLESSTFRILYSSEDAPKRSVIQDLVSPPTWNKKLATLVSAALKPGPFSVLVCGPKSAGKSTFSRLLTNRLITARSSLSSDRHQGVVILDLDPGQPEIALPGMLSLVHITQPNLSAPFTRTGLGSSSITVLRCHALAAALPATDPGLYRQCASDLYEYRRQHLPDLPLIINTSGWILGTGLELLDIIIGFTSPSEVVYMSEDGPAETVETLRSSAKNGFSTLPSQQAEFTTRTAAHLRAMHMMSYFHTRTGSDREAEARLEWEAAPLSSIVPWKIRYSGPQSGILAILSYDYQPPAELLAETINGMVLAAVEIEDSRAFRGLVGKKMSQPVVDRTPAGLPFIRNPNDIALDPRYSRCIGLVLVRGVDQSAQSLHVITPVSSDIIRSIKSQGRDIVLVNGKFDPPSWAYTEELYQRSGFEDFGDKSLEVVDDDTSEDDSDDGSSDLTSRRSMGTTPWVEVLRGNDKRPVGSKVWRVRRDLGRSTGDG